MNNSPKYLTHPAGYITDQDLISRALRKKIRFSVIIAHIALVFFPIIMYLVINWLKPVKPKTISVRLVSPPSPSPPQNNIAPPVSQPKNPETPPKKTKKPRKKKPKKTKPKWKPLKANDIKVSKNTVKSDPIPRVSHNDIANRLKKSLSQVKVASTTTTTNAELHYYGTVSAYLYRRWQQPNKSVLGNKRPTVDVHVAITSSGRVTSSKITRRSGFGVMDQSVQKLLSGLRSLPKPPEGAMELEITLEIVD